MKRISAIVGHTFGVLIMLSSFATTVWAEPVVLISTGTPEGKLFIPVKDLNSFLLCDGRQGTCSDSFFLINSSDFVIYDFHIVISPPLSMPIGGEGFGGFQLTGATGSTIDFAIPSGLRPGDTFTIALNGFSSNTVFFANATIPEPTTMLLLGTGLAGVAIKTRKRLKSRKSGQERK